MKKLSLYLIISFLFFTQCQSVEKKETTIEQGETFSIGDNSCACDSLKETNGIYYLENDIFTGICYSTYPMSEQHYIEKEILKGKIHGNVTYFDKNGNELYSETFENNELINQANEEAKLVNCSDLKKETFQDTLNQYFYKNQLYTGNCQILYPNTDQISFEASYKNGLLDGHSVYYNKDGSVLLIEKYSQGKLIKEVTPQ